MRSVLILAVAFFATAPVRAQPEPDSLAKIRARMLAALDHQPNYTCSETVERSSRPKPGAKLQAQDTLHFDVALVENRELFSWPGSGKFEEFSTAAKSVEGAIGAGDFGVHANALFGARSAAFQSLGEVDFQDKKALRFDYVMPEALSQYRVHTPSGSAVVGYHGSFYADPATFNVERIEVIADELPASLNLAKAEDTIDYALTPIGDENFLLPSGSSLSLYDPNGGETHNRVTFSACRKYAGESETTHRFDLPPGTSIILALNDEVLLKTAAIGDPIHARADKDVKSKGATLIAKGTAVEGRISRFEKYAGFSILGVQFSELGKGRLDQILCVDPVTVNFSVKGQKPAELGEVLIPMNPTQQRLTKGCVLYWKSERQ